VAPSEFFQKRLLGLEQAIAERFVKLMSLGANDIRTEIHGPAPVLASPLFGALHESAARAPAAMRFTHHHPDHFRAQVQVDQVTCSYVQLADHFSAAAADGIAPGELRHENFMTRIAGYSAQALLNLLRS
jgi:hypothetical protein